LSSKPFGKSDWFFIVECLDPKIKIGKVFDSYEEAEKAAREKCESYHIAKIKVLILNRELDGEMS